MLSAALDSHLRPTQARTRTVSNTLDCHLAIFASASELASARVQPCPEPQFCHCRLPKPPKPGHQAARNGLGSSGCFSCVDETPEPSLYIALRRLPVAGSFDIGFATRPAFRSHVGELSMTGKTLLERDLQERYCCVW